MLLSKTEIRTRNAFSNASPVTRAGKLQRREVRMVAHAPMSVIVASPAQLHQKRVGTGFTDCLLSFEVAGRTRSGASNEEQVFNNHCRRSLLGSRRQRRIGTSATRFEGRVERRRQ